MNFPTSLELNQQGKYNDLISQHLKEIPGRMFTFELTKCCNYSTLMFIYKEDNISDLFLQVAKHLGCQQLKSLYLLDESGQKVPIPFNSTTLIKEFIIANRSNMKPIYDVQLPVVYRIYVDDGHQHDDHTH